MIRVIAVSEYLESAFHLYYVQVELDSEKQLKLKSGVLLKRVNISANHLISGDSKGVINRHMWLGSIENTVMDTALLWINFDRL